MTKVEQFLNILPHFGPCLTFLCLGAAIMVANWQLISAGPGATVYIFPSPDTPAHSAPVAGIAFFDLVLVGLCAALGAAFLVKDVSSFLKRRRLQNVGV